MKTSIRDNLARFCYDGGRVMLAVLVVGTIAKKPFVWMDLVTGIGLTMTSLVFGAIIELIPAKE